MSSSRARTARPARNIALASLLILALLPLDRALASGRGLSSPGIGIPVSDQEVREKGNGYSFTRVERCLMSKINRKRARHGLRRLERDKQIGYVARVHAGRMAQAGAIYHDSQIGQEVTRWLMLGQNTGRGRRCGRLSRSFYRSSTHRANILGRWRFVGAGVRRSGGYLYVQQIFESRRDPGNVWHYP